MHILDSAPLVFALAMLVGVLAQAIARHVLVPGIVVLLGAGVALGPDVANVIRPAALGSAQHAVIGFAVAVILFEGGMRLELQQLRKQGVVIRRLVLLGGVITCAGATAACYLIMGWDLRLSILFGSLVIVTGPTVVGPLVRRIRLAPSLTTILEAEGVFIDAIGALVAIMALEVALSPTTGRFGAAALEVAERLALGAAIGAAGGLAIGGVLRLKKVIPHGMENIFALAGSVAVFEVSHALLSESGIPAAIVAGLVVGNMRIRRMNELAEFKEQLTTLLVGTLFVLLAADVRLADVAALGWPALGVVAVLIFVVRPVEVAACTIGTDLSAQQRGFLAWIAPRGIVAAAVASLFAETLSAAGIPGGVELRALVFMVIAVTVTLQGLTALPLAQLLGLRRAANSGYVLLGANALARHLARRLQAAGEAVEIIDYDADDTRAAEEMGLKVIHGNGLEPRTLTRARVDSRTHAAAVTGNEGVNLLFAQRIANEFYGPRVLIAVDPHGMGVNPEMVRERGAAVLFGRPIDVDAWVARWRKRSFVILRMRYGGSAPRPFASAPENDLLALFSERAGKLRLVDDSLELAPGDVVELAVPNERREQADAWLANDWTLLEELDAPEPVGQRGETTAVSSAPPIAPSKTSPSPTSTVQPPHSTVTPLG